MQILVTGGARHVGSHGVRGVCAGADEGAGYGDLADGGDRGAVMPFAPPAEVGESVREPLNYYRNNVPNTVSLLEVMRRHEVRKLVFSSTCAVYGVPLS